MCYRGSGGASRPTASALRAKCIVGAYHGANHMQGLFAPRSLGLMEDARPRLVCTREHVRLHFARDGGQVLHHLVAGEVVALPRNATPWVLQTGANGNAFLLCGPDSRWCYSVFQARVYASAEDGRLFIRKASGEVSWAHALSSSRTDFVRARCHHP